MQWMKEITSREGCSIKEILDSKEIKEVLKSTTLNKPQQVKAIVNILKSRRFPSFLRAKKSYHNGISRLSLPLGVRIIPPPFFEGVEYRQGPSQQFFPIPSDKGLLDFFSGAKGLKGQG